MPPYLPIVSLSRSQAVRIGRNNYSVPNQLKQATDASVTNPQTKALFTLFYANLGDGQVRRDIQHHTTLGAILPMGSPSLSVWCDLFKVSGLAVTAGSGFALSVATGVIQSRFYGSPAQLTVSAGSLTPAAPSAFDRVDQVTVTPAGALVLIPGTSAKAAATYEVDSVVTSGVPTGGTFVLSFVYNGFTYTTAAIAYNAAASAVASAVLAATGGPTLSTTLTGSGGALPTAVTLTASGSLEGPITNQIFNGAALTGGTAPSGTFTTTTAGVGAVPKIPGGLALPLANIFIPSTATSSSSYVITTIAQTS